MRFFSVGVNLDWIARQEARFDDQVAFGLVAEAGPTAELVGHAMFTTDPATDHAEVAFGVAAAYQGRGVATILLGQLAEVAAARGIAVFEAVVLPDNQRMLNVFERAGFPVHRHLEWGAVRPQFPTALGERELVRFDQRDEEASAAAVRRILAPRSVAVIGASRRPGSVGDAVVRNLLAVRVSGSALSDQIPGRP